MEWDVIIEALNETVRDDAIRAEIYKHIMLAGYHNEGEDYLGDDDVFDNVWHDVGEMGTDDDFIESINDLYDDQE